MSIRRLPPHRGEDDAAPPELPAVGSSHLRWRVVLCEAVDEPRRAIRWGDEPRRSVFKISRCEDYFVAIRVIREALQVERVVYSQCTALVSHTFDSASWVPAEAIRERRYCPVSRSRVLQIEYREGAEGAEALADTLRVPREQGVCWRCGRGLEGNRRSFCPECGQYRRRVINTLWKARTRRPRRRSRRRRRPRS